ncbi:MAG: PEP-CTERM sorting domain-containing protein [Planctomycetota bacterium]
MKRGMALAAVAACGVSAAAQVAPICIDWSVDGDGAMLANGQQLTDSSGSVFTFGSLFTMETFGSNLGATIFDTDPAGPNAAGPDPDLLVNRGNGVILQNSGSSTQTVPGIFDVPDDATTNNGRYEIDFTENVEILSIDLLDINGGNDVDIILTDGMGLTRTFEIPMDWTGDPTNNPPGWATLDLTNLAAQAGGGPGGLSNAFEDAGFDVLDVAAMEIRFQGSGGWNNLKFIPAPGTAALLGLGGLAAMRRRR